VIEVTFILSFTHISRATFRVGPLLPVRYLLPIV
jgi:hypothetical protein